MKRVVKELPDERENEEERRIVKGRLFAQKQGKKAKGRLD